MLLTLTTEKLHLFFMFLSRALNANEYRISTADGRTVFVPEGQHDSSQARRAWNHEENSPSQRDD
jgi:hypothetical protein